MENDHAAEELLTSRKHVENARSFMLVLALLVVIATIHLIWTCASISSAAQSLADRQKAASFLRDEDLALHRYLFEGDPHHLTAIEQAQKELRQLTGRVPSLNPLVDLEDSWFVNYAQPLIQKRKQLDAGEITLNELFVTQLQLRAEQERNRSQIIASEAGITFEAERLRRDIDHTVNVRVTIAVLIAIAAMLVALLGLRNVTALRQVA